MTRARTCMDLGLLPQRFCARCALRAPTEYCTVALTPAALACFWSTDSKSQ